MRNVSAEHWQVWRSGQFVGDDQPVCRATIQRSVVENYEGAWRSIVFGQDAHQKEIPLSNILAVNIDQRLGSDAAQMTLTLANQVGLSASTNLDKTHAGADPGVAGPSRRDLGDLGFPGYYTYNRGYTPLSLSRWGHEPDADWGDEFIPNRVIRTWQGYGTSGASNPWDDTKLTLTGTWLIDTVSYGSDGKISISCRDLAKLLIEQRLYPPIIPLEHYPLEVYYDHYETVFVAPEALYDEGYNPGDYGYGTYGPDPVTTEAVEGADILKYPDWDYNTSSAYWFSDKRNRSSCGHNPIHAFDLDPSTYWLSVANNPGTATWAYEWIEADAQGEYFNRIKIRTKWGGYRVYLSIMQDGQWIGTNVIPYSAGAYGAPNNSNIPYVSYREMPAGTDPWYIYELQFIYWADKIRLTFHNLAYTSSCPSSVSSPHRVGVIQIQAMVYTPSTTEEPPDVTVPNEEVVQTEQEIFVPGNIRDYTDIVKLFCAWAGFFWPDQPLDWVIDQWSTFTEGRIWGDFEYSGAYPVEPPKIDASYWDNKSVMDGINQIKEILGFLFYVDSTGGAVWRSPNIWQKGNFVTGVGYVSGEDTIEAIDENNVLIDYGVTIDDVALRSEIIVVSADQPDLAVSVSPGYAEGENIPETILDDLRLLGGQERVMIVPDYPFITQEEVIKFGYLTSLWMHWSYRKSRFRIPGNAAYEPDDQVRIYERTTSEAYIHYITGVSSNMDLVTGTWYLDIDTHWLGQGPDDRWVISYTDIAENSEALFAFLVQSGRIDEAGATAEGIDLDYYLNYPIEIPEVDWRTDPGDDLFPELPTIGDFTQTYISEGWDTTGGDPAAPTRGSYEGVRQYWGTHCTNQTWTGLVAASDFFAQQDNVKIETHSKLVSAGVWRAMREVIKDTQTVVQGHRTDCFECRQIARSSKWSYHAWGLAVDINGFLNEGWGAYYKSDGWWYYWNGNPYGSSPPGPSSVASTLASAVLSRIKLGTTGKSIFYWGGNWNTVKDYMHFEVHVTPTELDTHGVYLDGSPI